MIRAMRIPLSPVAKATRGSLFKPGPRGEENPHPAHEHGNLAGALPIDLDQRRHHQGRDLQQKPDDKKWQQDPNGQRGRASRQQAETAQQHDDTRSVGETRSARDPRGNGLPHLREIAEHEGKDAEANDPDGKEYQGSLRASIHVSSLSETVWWTTADVPWGIERGSRSSVELMYGSSRVAACRAVRHSTELSRTLPMASGQRRLAISYTPPRQPAHRALSDRWGPGVTASSTSLPAMPATQPPHTADVLDTLGRAGALRMFRPALEALRT